LTQSKDWLHIALLVAVQGCAALSSVIDTELNPEHRPKQSYRASATLQASRTARYINAR